MSVSQRLADNAEVRKTLRYLAQRWRDLAVTAVAESDWKRAPAET